MSQKKESFEEVYKKVEAIMTPHGSGSGNQKMKHLCKIEGKEIQQ